MKETQELGEVLKRKFQYNPETGEITRKTKGKSKVGSISQGYLRIKVNNSSYLAHRIIWFLHYGKWPDGEIDHINRIRNDNRICNLRDVDKSVNQRNAHRQHNNKSGFSGVSFSNAKQKWVVTASVNQKKTYFGSFECLGRAVATRRKAERENGYSNAKELSHGN